MAIEKFFLIKNKLQFWLVIVTKCVSAVDNGHRICGNIISVRKLKFLCETRISYRDGEAMSRLSLFLNLFQVSSCQEWVGKQGDYSNQY